MRNLRKNPHGITLPAPRQDRIIGAAAAPVICEAAAVPLHWIYDKNALREALSACPDDEPAFAPPACPYYRVPFGENGCYGDQAMAMLKYLAGEQSYGFDASRFARFLTIVFGSGGRYGEASARASARYHGKKPVDDVRTAERRTNHAGWPINGPWLHSGLRTLLTNRRNLGHAATGDPHDDQADGTVKAGAMAACFHNLAPEQLECHVDAAVRVSQNNHLASAAARFVALVCQRQISGRSVTIFDSVEHIRKTFANDRSERPDRLRPQKWAERQTAQAVAMVTEELPKLDGDDQKSGHAEMVDSLGNDCHEPGNLAAALHGVLEAEQYARAERMKDPDGILAWAVRRDIRAGGCNCSRVCQIAAILGATYGRRAIPDDWIEKASNAVDAVKLARALAL